MSGPIVDSSQPMTSHRYVHLPTEVIMHIAKFILDDWSKLEIPSSQDRLRRLCSVSRQWYSAGIEYLYYRPLLHRGNSFTLFTNTVCPPIRSRQRKVDLGSLVHALNLGPLVHHSSNSLTARLLGRVKKNLEIFVAPRVSFAVNSLAPLAKCKELSYLCLSTVADPIPFSTLKKAISGLDKLKSIELPRSTCITDDGSTDDWPPNLEYLKIGGKFDIEKMSSFRWPPNLVGLTLCGCEDLDTFGLEGILINEQLRTTLEQLTIHSYNRGMFMEVPSDILSTLTALNSLRIPVDMLYTLLILPSSEFPSSPMSIRELELLSPHDEDFSSALVFHPNDLCKALKTDLSRVCYIGISPGCLDIIPEKWHDEIDKWVWKNIDKCSEEEFYALSDVGVGVMDREPFC